jgi:hypothetical protein
MTEAAPPSSSTPAPPPAARAMPAPTRKRPSASGSSTTTSSRASSTCPENLFYNTTAPGIVLFLNKAKPKERKGKVFLVNASQVFEKGDPKNFIPDAGIQRIADTLIGWKEAEKLSRIVDHAELKKNDYNISPSRYIHTSDAETYNALAHRDTKTPEHVVSRSSRPRPRKPTRLLTEFSNNSESAHEDLHQQRPEGICRRAQSAGRIPFRRPAAAALLRNLPVRARRPRLRPSARCRLS